MTDINTKLTLQKLDTILSRGGHGTRLVDVKLLRECRDEIALLMDMKTKVNGIAQALSQDPREAA